MVDPNNQRAANLDSCDFFLPTVQISQGMVALFEKIYDGEPILTVFSVLHHRCFNSMYYVRTTSQSNANAVFANNYLPVLYSNIRNRAVLGLSQVAQIFVKISAIRLK
jgi:hypothetical protein